MRLHTDWIRNYVGCNVVQRNIENISVLFSRISDAMKATGVVENIALLLCRYEMHRGIE